MRYFCREYSGWHLDEVIKGALKETNECNWNIVSVSHDIKNDGWVTVVVIYKG